MNSGGKYVSILIVLVIGLLMPTHISAASILNVSGDQTVVVIAVDYNDTSHNLTKQQISDKIFVNVSDYYANENYTFDNNLNKI